MAIGKLTKGNNAAGLVDYILADQDHKGEHRDRAVIVGGTLGFDAQAAKAHLGALKNLRPSLTRNVAHMSISLPEGDRALSDEEWSQIGDMWAAQMGFEAYMTVCHGDHIHIAASRIRLDGSVVSDAHDFRRSEAVIREIEARFDLIHVQPSHLLDPSRARDHVAAPTRGEFEMADRGVISTKARLQVLLNDLTAAPITATDFVEALEECGVDVRPNVSAETGTLSGFSFGLDGHHISASQIGRKFSLKHLNERGFTYEQDRDFSTLIGAKERSVERALARSTGADARIEPRDASADRGASNSSGEETTARDRGASAGGGGHVHPKEGRETDRPEVALVGEGAVENAKRPERTQESPRQVGDGDKGGTTGSPSGFGGASRGSFGDAWHGTGDSGWSILDGDDWEALFRFFKDWSRSITASRGGARTSPSGGPPALPATEPQRQLRSAADGSGPTLPSRPTRVLSDPPDGSSSESIGGPMETSASENRAKHHPALNGCDESAEVIEEPGEPFGPLKPTADDDQETGPRFGP